VIVAKPLDFDELIAKLHRYNGERRYRPAGARFDERALLRTSAWH
jgi:hypothetical protein